MIISITALSWLVGIATTITVLAPIVLMYLWMKDWLKKQLW